MFVALGADIAQPGTCLKEGAKLVGAAPILIGKQVRMPKKTRNVPPKYPQLPPGTSGSRIWRGEFLIDQGGAVVEVWTLEEVRLKPAYPPFNQAIVDAIRQWKFDPPRAAKGPVPACSTVSITIDWS